MIPIAPFTLTLNMKAGELLHRTVFRLETGKSSQKKIPLPVLNCIS